MKMEELTFPLTAEAFVAYQEAGAGRELSEDERDVLQSWVPVINDCYVQRTKGDAGAMGERLDRMEVCLAQAADNPIVARILKAMRWWMCYAYKRGCADAGVEE